MSQNRYAPAKPHDLVRRGLKFSQLRLIDALAATQQVGAAADRLGMTQPAASRLLRQLEELVGAPLYVRHTRGVSLTEAGMILADQAARTLRGLDLSQERISETTHGMRGHVRVGAVTGPSLDLVLPVIRKMRVSYPQIEISVEVGTSDEMSESLLNYHLDVYIGRVPDAADPSLFTFRAIGPEPLALIVRMDHPLLSRRALDLAQCLEFDWVMQPPGGLLRRTVEAYLMERGYGLPARTVSTTSTLFTLAMISDTNAVAPLARKAADFFIARAALGSRLAHLPVAEDIAVVAYGLVRRAGEASTPATDRLIAGIEAELARVE
ncbi:LysR family transcriptional regulator [Puniceibacterium sp. IMCC21224]|uniref:LysR family transcriptional regulator n=1 Tax=Puniceibacterium sp. IMCC21224 TaxID=1618204 RepID=UPI00064D8099|nr:LysR substrate-binding domain-containing protein [Puniceibacterium sp. IMCC21224]KMK64991.1 transcriptional regulator [Puniceibacterium sp. IMCC21224]